MSEALDPKVAKALEAAMAGWDQLEAAPAYKELVAGDYLCRFEPTKSRPWMAKTGQVGIKICFVIEDGGEFDGRRLYVDLWPNAQDIEGKKMAKRDLGYLGLTPADFLKTPPGVEAKFIVTIFVGGDVKMFELAV